MTFFRAKKIKGKEYIYLVENEWIKGKTRQKVKEYLGRAYNLELKKDVDFLEFNKISLDDLLKKTVHEIVLDLLEWEQSRYDIFNGFTLDPKSMQLKKKNKDVVLLINEGFMCTFTLKKLFGFQPINHEQDTFRLARAFVEAGIKIPQDVFVGLCEKMFKFEE